jgi:hypothetical protein
MLLFENRLGVLMALLLSTTVYVDEIYKKSNTPERKATAPTVAIKDKVFHNDSSLSIAPSTPGIMPIDSTTAIKHSSEPVYAVRTNLRGQPA